jgi:DNA-directed RNA polymerase specialized sigma24 family protein
VTVTAEEPVVAAPEDPEAFGEWLRPHVRAIGYLVARLAPTADRDDVVQDVLVRAWVKRRSFDGRRGAASSWLLAIAADQARKARRRARPTAPLAEAESGVSGPTPGQVDLDNALRRLSKRQRLAVECVYFVGLTVAETAAVMRCADGTVKSTLADARARLRTLLEVAP